MLLSQAAFGSEVEWEDVVLFFGRGIVKVKTGKSAMAGAG